MSEATHSEEVGEGERERRKGEVGWLDWERGRGATGGGEGEERKKKTGKKEKESDARNPRVWTPSRGSGVVSGSRGDGEKQVECA